MAPATELATPLPSVVIKGVSKVALAPLASESAASLQKKPVVMTSIKIRHTFAMKISPPPCPALAFPHAPSPSINVTVKSAVSGLILSSSPFWVKLKN